MSDTFVSNSNESDILELRHDKTFNAVQGGRKFSGTYEFLDGDLTLIIGNTRQQAKLAGDTLTDTGGKQWTRSNLRGPSHDPKSVDAEVIGNADVVKLVQAKFPDSIIIGKIKSSPCRFDLRTDALIKLKEANVSDAVMQAMVDAPQK